MKSLSEILFVLLQRILPKHLLTAAIYALARVRNPAIKDFLIRQFVRGFRVNTDEAAKPVPSGYATFNDFFVRELADGARAVDREPSSLISPVDGTVSAIGTIHGNRIFQAKGKDYALADLLGTKALGNDQHSEDLVAESFVGGQFATIYLAPYNYHRIHAPLSGQLHAARYIPGALFSVNGTTARRLPRLFARNERLACHFKSESSHFSVVFVGALNVGSITTPWTGEIRPQKRGASTDCALDACSADRQVDKGDLLGWFNMGSTVILLLPPNTVTWNQGLEQGTVVRMGEALGRLTD